MSFPHLPDLFLSESVLSTPRCKFCGFESVDKRVVALHERIIHPAEMSALFFCLFCPAKLNSIVGVQLHTSRKHGINHIPYLNSETTTNRVNELKNGWVIAEDDNGEHQQFKALFYLQVFGGLGSSYCKVTGEDDTDRDFQAFLQEKDKPDAEVEPAPTEAAAKKKTPKQLRDIKPKQETKNYNCAICDFSSKYGSSLRRHLKSHKS